MRIKRLFLLHCLSVGLLPYDRQYLLWHGFIGGGEWVGRGQRLYGNQEECVLFGLEPLISHRDHEPQQMNAPIWLTTLQESEATPTSRCPGCRCSRPPSDQSHDWRQAPRPSGTLARKTGPSTESLPTCVITTGWWWRPSGHMIITGTVSLLPLPLTATWGQHDCKQCYFHEVNKMMLFTLPT